MFVNTHLCNCLSLGEFLFKKFQRQGANHSLYRHMLPVPVPARYVRFHPTQQYNWNCMRVEMYSSKFQKLRRNPSGNSVISIFSGQNDVISYL